MEQKYYELVKKLIEDNRRYVGLDDVLEDIIEDVFLHSKTVMESVKDENVILDYLSKVVTTSIITVSRRTKSRLAATEISAVKKEQNENLSFDEVSESEENISEDIAEIESVQEENVCTEQPFNEGVLVLNEDSESIIDLVMNENSIAVDEFETLKSEFNTQEEEDDAIIDLSDTIIEHVDVQTESDEVFVDSEDNCILSDENKDDLEEENVETAEEIKAEVETEDFLIKEESSLETADLLGNSDNENNPDTLELDNADAQGDNVLMDVEPVETSLEISEEIPIEAQDELPLTLDEGDTLFPATEGETLIEVEENAIGLDLYDTDDLSLENDDSIADFGDSDELINSGSKNDCIDEDTLKELQESVASVLNSENGVDYETIWELRYKQQLTIDDIADKMNCSEDDVVAALDNFVRLVEEC